MSGQQSLSSTGYAVSSERVELHLEGTDRLVPDRFSGDVKVTVTPRGAGPVFVGIAPAADAAVGAPFPGIGLVIWVLLAINVVLFVLAVILMVLGLRSGNRSPTPGAPVREAAAP